jgi:hypothetical protein
MKYNPYWRVCRTVGIGEPHMRSERAESSDGLGVDLFAPDKEPFKRRKAIHHRCAFGGNFDQCIEDRRHEVCHRHLMAADQFDRMQQIEMSGLAGNDDLACWSSGRP